MDLEALEGELTKYSDSNNCKNNSKNSIRQNSLIALSQDSI
jgi:hypothetical protein